MCECDLCECRGYLLYLLLEDIQLIIQTTQNQTSRGWASSKHSLDSTVNWINIFPDWLCLTAAQPTPGLFQSLTVPTGFISSSTSLQSIFLRIDGDAGAVGTGRRSTAHCPGCGRTWVEVRVCPGERQKVKETKTFKRATVIICFSCSFTPDEDQKKILPCGWMPILIFFRNSLDLKKIFSWQLVQHKHRDVMLRYSISNTTNGFNYINHQW